MGGYAWVTLATNNSYSLGALVLAHSLKKSNTAHKLVVLITSSVSEPMRNQLATVFDVVKLVDVLDSKDEAHLALMQRPELGITFTKIHCWRLIEFEKCVFLDADTLVVRNCDELFEREEFSAAPDASWPDCFNSGVFVYRPSIETFNKILQFAVENKSFDGGDQGLLNQFFSNWATEDIKKHLPFVYNLTSIGPYAYIPAFKHYGSETRIVHFIGTGKPWLHQLDISTKTVTPSSGYEHMGPLLQQWWDLFCEKVHPNLDKNLESSNEGMSHSPVEARSSNPLPIALTDEPQTLPCTPQRETVVMQHNYLPLKTNYSSGESPKPPVTPQIIQKSEIIQPRTTTPEKIEEEHKEEKKEQQPQEEPPPEDPFDYNSFVPDETCIQSYLEQNVVTYQPFERQEIKPPVEEPLPRFLTLPEDDKRQSGNVTQPPEKQPTPEREQPPRETLIKSKSMPFLPLENIPEPPQPPRSIWKSQPNVNIDPNKKYSMPRLKPLLPKQNSKSVRTKIPKITLYTEFLMSSEYKDPVNLPKDRIGFVATQLHAQKHKRNKPNGRSSKFGPLPFIPSPEGDKPICKKIRLEHSDDDLYDLTQCKRQSGNKPKAKHVQDKPNGNNLDEILKRLKEFSKDYQHYFEVIPKPKKKTVMCRNAVVQDGESRLSDVFKTVRTTVCCWSRGTQTTNEFRLFRDYVKDQNEACHKGLLMISGKDKEGSSTTVAQQDNVTTARRMKKFGKKSRKPRNRFGNVDDVTTTHNGGLLDNHVESSGVRKQPKSEITVSTANPKKALETKEVYTPEVGNVIRSENSTESPGENVAQLKTQLEYTPTAQKKEVLLNLQPANGEDVKSTKILSENEEKHAAQCEVAEEKQTNGDVRITQNGDLLKLGDDNVVQCANSEGLFEKQQENDVIGVKNNEMSLSLEKNECGANEKNVEAERVQSETVKVDDVTNPSNFHELDSDRDKSDVENTGVEEASFGKDENHVVHSENQSDDVKNLQNVTSTLEKLQLDEKTSNVAVLVENQHNGVLTTPKRQSDCSKSTKVPENPNKVDDDVTGQGKSDTDDGNFVVHSKTKSNHLASPDISTESSKVCAYDCHRGLNDVSSDSGTDKETTKMHSENPSDDVTNGKSLDSPEVNAIHAEKQPELVTENNKPDDVTNSLLPNSEKCGLKEQPNSLPPTVINPESSTAIQTNDVISPQNVIPNPEPVVENGHKDEKEGMKPEEMLCVPDFETPKSSRVTSKTEENTKSRKTNFSPMKVKEKFDIPVADSPDESVRFSGKNSVTCGRDELLEEPKDTSGIAGAIAQLSLQAGSEQTPESTAASAAHQEYLRRQNWETGNIDYMGRDSFDNIWSKICQTLETKEQEPQPTGEMKKPLETPEYIETLPGKPAPGPVDDDEIIFSRGESRQSELTNITEEEEIGVKLSDILGEVKGKPVVGAVGGLATATDTKQQPQAVPTGQQPQAIPPGQQPQPKAVSGSADAKTQLSMVPVAEPTSTATPPAPKPASEGKPQPGTTPSPTDIVSQSAALTATVQPQPVATSGSAVTKTSESLPSLLDGKTKVEPFVSGPPDTKTVSGAQPTAGDIKTQSEVVPSEGKSQPKNTEATSGSSDTKSQPLAVPGAETATSTDVKQQTGPQLGLEDVKAQPAGAERQSGSTDTKTQLPVVPAVPTEPPAMPSDVKPQSEPKSSAAEIKTQPESVTPSPAEAKTQLPVVPAVPTEPLATPSDVKQQSGSVEMKPSDEPKSPEGVPSSADGKIQPPIDSPLPLAPSPEMKPPATTPTSPGECKVVAIPSPPIIPPEPHPKLKQQQQPKPQVQSEPIPLPPPDSENKQKKGVFTKILEMVGVKDKNGSEENKSVFYDTQSEKQQSIQVEETKRKSPSPKLKMPTTPETEVTTPTPPPVQEKPQRKNSGLLKVEETILETPPVPETSTVQTEIEDIIGKAKTEVETLMQKESSDSVNTMKLMMGEQEELKVTSEEDRKKHKGEAPSSKLSDQILKAIPPPRRKAISEASTSAIPKEQKSPQAAEGKSKSKPSSIPVPPPRNKGKPQPPPTKGKGKK